MSGAERAQAPDSPPHPGAAGVAAPRPGEPHAGGDARAARIGIAACTLLAALLVLPNLGNQYLWQDEAQTALVADTIRSHGVPRGSDGRNFFSQELGKEYGEGLLWRWHTWLSFYAVAGSFAALGKSTFAARLPFALFGIASVALAGLAARRLWRRPHAAVAAAAMLALSVPFLIFSRQCRYYTMCAFFTLWGVHAYAGLRRGARRPALALFAAAFLLFHTHYVYVATLFAALLVHAALLERERLAPTATVAAAVAAVNVPWIVWFAGVRPGGGGYLASVLDVGKAAAFTAGYAELVFAHLFDARLLAIVPAVAVWDRVREGHWPGVSRDTASGVALLALLVAVTAVGLAVLSPLLFYRYLAPLAPLLALVAGLLVGTLARRSLVAGGLALVLWLAPGSLVAYTHELRHDFDGPIEGIVEFLRARADPDDLVAISYGDLPLKFYTDLRVIGGLTGEDLSALPRADWIVLRRHTNTRADRETQERMRALLAAHPDRYVAHRLEAPDTAFENREDPRRHRFRTAHPSLPRVVVFERRAATAGPSPDAREPQAGAGAEADG